MSGESERRPERRRHIRYLVEGTLTLTIGDQKYVGKPANLGLGGLLFTAERVPKVGPEGLLQLDLTGASETILVAVRVVRTYEQAVAAKFLEAPAALEKYIGRLAAR